jgi:NTE family protein
MVPILYYRRIHSWLLPLMLLISIIFISSCAHTPSSPPTPTKPTIALVLGGGGARGFAHIGVIRELEAEKIPVQILVGVSVGSLIGALYADSGDSFTLEWNAFQIEKKEIFDFTLLNLREGLARGDAIKYYVDRHVRVKNIEQLKIPLAIVATDLRSGSPVVFRSGSIRDAIRASISIPGVFTPVVTGNQVLVDGGVLGNLAPQAARDMGATFVIGVSLSKGRPTISGSNPSAMDVVMDSIELMGAELVRLNSDKMDILIEPDVGKMDIMDFSKKKEMIEAGRLAAKTAMPEIKRRLGLTQ